jgi:undecaprenyl-diphosphatase
MSELLEAILLGLVQGLTEFLPVSSSGHLALFEALLGWEDAEANLAFNVAVHVGSLLAVMVFVRREIVAMLTTRPRLLLVVAVATVPAALFGPLGKGAVQSLSASVLAVGLCLLVTAGILLLAGRTGRGTTLAPDLGWGRALLVGFAQLLAILPGVSRSGSTLVAGMGVGLERGEAVRFSFLMAAPAIAGAGLFMVIEGGGGNPVPLVPTLAGGAASFVASLVAMRLLVRIVARDRLRWFALYCAVAGLVAIACAL